jgi:hypothetical protein
MQRLKHTDVLIAIEKGHITTSDPESALLNALVDTLRYYDNMAGDAFKAPALSQATAGFIVDELGEIRAEIKPRQIYEKLLSTFLKDKIGTDFIPPQSKESENAPIAGEKYQGAFKWVSKLIADQDAISRYLTNREAFAAGLGKSVAQLDADDFKKVSEYWEFRTSLKAVEVK